MARVPLTVQQKRSWDRNEQPTFANSKEESTMGRSVDLTRLDGSEDDKIRAMMTQSTQDYDPSKSVLVCSLLLSTLTLELQTVVDISGEL